MSDLPHILVHGTSAERLEPIAQALRQHCRITRGDSIPDALRLLAATPYDGVCVLSPEISPTGFLLEATGLLQQLPDGLALLDSASRVLWSNGRFRVLAGPDRDVLGQAFFDLFSSSELLGPDYGPFHSALATGESTRTLMRIGEMSFLELTATPVIDSDEEMPSYLLALVRDVSEETIERQKLDAIYRAGLELGDLQPQDVLDMSVAERVELLKSKILHYTRDVLEFDTVEIRLVEPATKRLAPLLAVGMEPLAENRELFAYPEGNGVTGFVAATGRSYLCEDISQDPLYLPGAPGARSSLTVPLVLHEEILGTFNVESPRPRAFAQADLQFLELFCRELAIAINTLKLLVVEKASSTSELAQRLLKGLHAPVNRMLNDLVWLADRIDHHDSDSQAVIDRLIDSVQAIRGGAAEVCAEQSAGVTSPTLGQVDPFNGRSLRILIADAEPETGAAARDLLGRLGCTVETAGSGGIALLMAGKLNYDLVIGDIRLPDMNGAELYRRFCEGHPGVPVVLMTGFGYDAGHSLVKARQMGLRTTVLFKPFRRDLLLKAICEAVQINVPPSPPKSGVTGM
ncbi:MAG: response regulator [Planctomycetaceae bacterium]